MDRELKALLAALDQAATEVADLTITYGRIWQGFEKCFMPADSNIWVNRWRGMQELEKEIEATIKEIRDEQ